MKTKIIAWTLASSTFAVTAAGAFFPEPVLAIGSVVVGGCALTMALHTWTQVARQKVNAKMLEQLR